MELAKVAMLKRSVAAVLGMVVLTEALVIAQNLTTKDELSAIEQAQITNQKRLSRYAWQETQLISVNGEAVDYRMYSVSIAKSGQYERNLVTENTGQEAIFEPNKKEQLSPDGSYAQRLLELASQYTSLDSERLTQASGRGDILLLREGDVMKLSAKNYFKPGDSLDMTINQRTHSLLTVQAKSYPTDPQDSVTIRAEFAELPDGTNHVATLDINSVSKHLTLKLTNWSYQ